MATSPAAKKHAPLLPKAATFMSKRVGYKSRVLSSRHPPQGR